MARTGLAQFSFNRGELDPALHGRSDWKYYFSGAEKLKNFIVRRQGGAVKRGGFRLVSRALDDALPSRLIPFRFSVGQSYMLEFGNNAMRILRDGGVVVYPAGHARAGEEVRIDTPYARDALSGLRYAQTADVMILTHPDYPPRRLSRRDHHDWQFERLFPESMTPAPGGLRLLRSGGDNARYVVTAVNDKTGESSPSDAVVAENDGAIDYDTAGKTFSELFSWLYQHDYTYLPDELNFYGMTEAELIAFLRKCGYADQGTGMRPNGTGGAQWLHVKPDGSRFQTIDWWPNNINPLINECLYACTAGWAGNVSATLQSWIDKYVRDYNASLTGTHISELQWNPAPSASKYRIYRETGMDGYTHFRLIGTSQTTKFTDQNFNPLQESLPEQGEQFSSVDQYPGVCAFFEQRLILGRTNAKPTTFWGSETGVYNSFGLHTPIEDSDRYEFTLASGEMNEINWIVPLNELLLGTSGSEWKAGGGAGAITPSNINARVQSWYGCSPLPPLVIGRTVLFTGRSRNTVRNLSYSLEADGYSGRDLTAYASHLFAGKTIVSMCHQCDPSGIIWMVMSDGTLLSCTYEPEEDVVAWSRHETQGRFEWCASVATPGGADDVYCCTTRTIGGKTRRFIEIMMPPSDQTENESTGFFVDCGLSYRGNPTGIVRGLDHLEGEQVTCLADGSVFENLEVRGGAIELPSGIVAAHIHAGLSYQAALTTMELEPERTESIRTRSRFAVSAAIRFYKTRECLYGQNNGILSEIKFRTAELPGQPARLFTGEKNVGFSSPPGTSAVTINLVSSAPVPCTVLAIFAEARHGQPT